ncbi:MAG: inosine/xanthosine triphosphatase [Anaerolineales bacterium]|jgi:inosine/xanthosine triphosphatase
MKSIILASQNPVKIRATKAGFQRMFPDLDFDISWVSVPSGVREQPVSDEETLRGAFNRAQAAKDLVHEADFWVGIEGGVEQSEYGMLAFAWVVILSNNHKGKGRTGAFFLPKKVAEIVRSGKELGDADDIVFGRVNSKQKQGAVGLLTEGVIERADFYEQAVILALVPFKKPGLYLG